MESALKSPIENESEVEEASMGTSFGNIGETNVNFVQNEIEIDAVVTESKSDDELPEEELVSTTPEVNTGTGTDTGTDFSRNDILDLA